ncbi:MAG: hypothetical protein A3E87_07395 [Gammaproteobacteria bacterium RIFCSPHIGHO2_12_FULL_35_23]|nr:MAG: hypothetical protein A3E87_07395 [Gammaproteobacteria bacterium RIFCSPHIGHO2_12_FULL_35_23]
MMSNYVLIHGGNSNGQVWEKVANFLIANHHQIWTPTLLDEKTSTLTEHIASICQLIESQNIKDVILVGHSYGGMVVTGIANNLTRRINRLIYVDAAIPDNNQSLFEIINATGLDAINHYHLDPYPPFITPITFDSSLIKNIPKTFIFCQRSEFKSVTEAMSKKVLHNINNWTYFELNATHNPMQTAPFKLAQILMNN